MRVIVTGGSGFIGTNLVERALSRGDEVINLDVVAPRHPDHADHWRSVDVTDGPALKRVIAEFQPEVVLHMAARTDLRGRSISDYPANTLGVANLIAALQDVPTPKAVVFASSMLVCKLGYQPRHETDYCPTTPYGQSKVETERLVRSIDADRLPWAILRPTSIWGPWFGTPYRDFFDTVKRGLYLHPRHRRVRRSYGFVLNSVQQIEHLVDCELGALRGRMAYMADYSPVELHEWATEISTALQAPPVRQVPVPLLRVAARVGDGLQALGLPKVPLTSFRLSNMLTDSVLDTAPLAAVLPKLPYAMPEGVAITCRWLSGLATGEARDRT